MEFHSSFLQFSTVFPEYTLNNVAFPVIIPHPEDKIVPCLDAGSFDNLVKDLSCLAQQNNLYLSINLSEQEDCTEENQLIRNDTRPCSRLGINRFNTNVVFDRNGTVIARYRKWNLFREGGVNQTVTPELSVFETDFGVTFGQFVCFDLLFYEPAIELIKIGIKNFIFPAMWVAELPFLSCEFGVLKDQILLLKLHFPHSNSNLPELVISQ